MTGLRWTGFGQFLALASLALNGLSGQGPSAAVLTLEVVMHILDWLWLVLGFDSCRPDHDLTCSGWPRIALARCGWAWLILTLPGWALTLAGLGQARAGPWLTDRARPGQARLTGHGLWLAQTDPYSCRPTSPQLGGRGCLYKLFWLKQGKKK